MKIHNFPGKKKMRNIVYGFIVLILALSGCALHTADRPAEVRDDQYSGDYVEEEPTVDRGIYQNGDYNENVTVDGLERSYALHIPPVVSQQAPLPLIIVLHGGHGQSSTAQRLGFDTYADERGFYVAYPESYQGMRWNDGRSTVDSLEANVDDVAFILAMIEEIAEKTSLDRTRVYVTGASNGGMMTYRLGCETSGVFAGVAPVIANIPRPIADTCLPHAPIDFFAINGDADPLVPIEGGEVCRDVRVGCEKGFVISMPDSVAKFVAANECDPEPQSKTLPAAVDDGTYIEWHIHFDCTNDVRVQTYIVHNGGHTWPPLPAQIPAVGQATSNFDATETIVEFFIP